MPIHPLSGFFILVLSSYLVLGCKQHDEKEAGVKHFYFECIDNVKSDFTKDVVNHVAAELPLHDYFISNESADKGWPYFGMVPKGKKVLKTDLTPPHTMINRFSPIESLKSYNKGEQTMKVVFTIDQEMNNAISITKKSFKWKEDKWVQLSMTITTDFKTQTNTKDKVFREITKTLIRYTFK